MSGAGLHLLRFFFLKRIIIRVVSLREQLFQTVRRLAGNILTEMGEKENEREEFIRAIRKFMEMRTLTKQVLNELIDHIEVYPAVKEDGVTNQRVTIHYNCIGAFEVPDRRKIPERDILLETRKGVALSYAPAV